MIQVKRPAEKRALAGVLREHDPGYLDDLKMFSDAFGPMAALTYRADDPQRQAAIAEDYRSRLAQEAGKSRERAMSALAAAKEAAK